MSFNFPNKYQAKVKSIFPKVEIDNVQKQKEAIKHQFFDKILDEILQKIKYYSSRSATDGIFQVPTQRIGYPDYDYRELLFFLINKLRELNFFVRYIPEVSLYISWLNEEKLTKDVQLTRFITQEKKLTKEFITKSV
jgi:hypothetical protein